ncbi:MAG: alpha/beta hydrolase family protein [Gemmataceae bacterium]|nr:alpha/beta hydrolase family protein [Gemmataceae bacterium]
MAEPNDSERYNLWVRERAKALRAADRPPTTQAEWRQRREKLRREMLQAMGPWPETPAELRPEILGTIERKGYRIERLIFQSQPDVWVTAHLYVPEGAKRSPAVLVVHGHWAMARRDPVVQARCLGLVKLGFVVLAIDAFGSGERHAQPARGTYHGALDGAALWPTGRTLLGLQVYDNRRAVDYLLTRPEVDPARIGITGASGGGNQSMYAGALDDRIACVVPVCSVGQYQAYLQAACCVCEVLPRALTFTEEGDVLALVAPRALMVINASRDAFQFSPGEAEKSVARARHVYDLLLQRERIRHVVFDSGHDYNKPMREAMYGWMSRWLKDVGDGSPIPEPEFELESPETLACFPELAKRPTVWMTPTRLAGRLGRELIAKSDQLKPRHAEEWESTAVEWRARLETLLGGMPKLAAAAGRAEGPPDADDPVTLPVRIRGEDGLPIPTLTLSRRQPTRPRPGVIVLHLDGKSAAIKHPLPRALATDGWFVALPDLRATGVLKPAHDAIATAPDHNSAEHGVWIGRPLLGQWVVDVRAVAEWLAIQGNRDESRMCVIGLDAAGIVALAAAALWPDRFTSAALVQTPVLLITDEPYPKDTRMGLLAPGLFTVGDVPHLAALVAPRRLFIVGGRRIDSVDPLGELALTKAFDFTRSVYQAHRRADKLTITSSIAWNQLARQL